MMNRTQFARLLFLTWVTMLSGCMFSRGSIEKMQDHYAKKTFYQDEIFAVGVNKTPLKGFENSLILVSKNYSYIAQSEVYDERNQVWHVTDDLSNIFKSLDLTRLNISADPFDQVRSAKGGIGQTTVWLVDINKADSMKPIQKFSTQVYLLYPVALNSAEMNKLENLGFRCPAENSRLAYCHTQVSLQVTVAPKVQNINALQHTFRKPVKLLFQTSAVGIAKPVQGALMLPFAVVVDVVTFPLQWAFCVGSMVGC